MLNFGVGIEMGKEQRHHHHNLETTDTVCQSNLEHDSVIALCFITKDTSNDSFEMF